MESHLRRRDWTDGVDRFGGVKADRMRGVQRGGERVCGVDRDWRKGGESSEGEE